jgi:2-oxoglutarate ferredoxin oxidoreductase subunit gamma
MKTEIIFAGFGGQGILLMGKTIGQAAMSEGKYVTYLPSYGPEMRSGTSNCNVVISDHPIASPVIGPMDALVAMNQPSYQKFVPRIRRNGVLVYNETMVTPDDSDIQEIRCVGGPFTSQAGELGTVRVSSMIALGRLVRELGLVGFDAICAEMKQLTAKRPEFMDINEQALKLGYEAG